MTYAFLPQYSLQFKKDLKKIAKKIRERTKQIDTFKIATNLKKKRQKFKKSKLEIRAIRLEPFYSRCYPFPGTGNFYRPL